MNISNERIEAILDNASRVPGMEYNVTQATGASYASFTEARSAATACPKKYGIVLSWLDADGNYQSKRFDGTTESEFTDDSKWVDTCGCYEFTPPEDVIIINQTISDPAGMISGDVKGEVVTWIRENSHRVLAKKTAEGEVTYCRLMDTDGTKYHDGTDASASLKNVDSFVKLPEFWYYGTEGDNAEIHFTNVNPNDDETWCHWDTNTLIGVYEAYNNTGGGNKLCSISNVVSTGSVSQANFKQYARNKGNGYQLVDWQMHCVMCALFYAWYGNTNSQAICGAGTDSYTKETGQTNSLGMTDTTTENGNSISTNFWGLENWWGNKYEFMDNIVSTAQHNVNIESPDPYPRSLVWSHGPTWGKHYKIGKYLDMSSDVSDSGSDTTYYCDQNFGPVGASRVAGRSSVNADTGGGVSYAYASSVASSANVYYGSRVGFRGTCIEETDPSIFASIQNLTNTGIGGDSN